MNWLAAAQQFDRPTDFVRELEFGIDAEDVIDHGQDIRGPQGAILGLFAARVGGTNDMTTFESAAAQKGEAGLAPVIAAAARHLRRAAELTPNQQEHPLV